MDHDDDEIPMHATSFQADQMFFEADQKIKQGQITEALELLLDVVEQHPGYGRAYNHLGYIYETKYQDYHNARYYYDKALRYAPSYPATYVNYTILLSSLGDYEKLEELLNKALQIAGVNKERIYNEYGIMRELQQQYDQAINCFRKAILASLKEESIESYQKNIERCKMKVNVFRELQSDVDNI